MKTYEVTINFGGFIGCSETYIVHVDNENEARDEALELAMDDLYIECVEEV